MKKISPWFTRLAIAAVLAGGMAAAQEKTQDVPPGFDRPLVIDRYLERKVVALEKSVEELRKEVAELKAQMAELQAGKAP